MITLQPPIVQLAIDVLTIDQALRIAEMGVRAGVDWLEAGTPLVTFAGTSCIGALAREFPNHPILADYKTMDGARKYMLETAKQGGHISTVCAVASDATVQTAVEGSKEAGTRLIADLYACPSPTQRAMEMEAMGVDSVYVHWGSDQRSMNPDRDPLADVQSVAEAVSIPVGTATFAAEDAVRGIQLGAGIVVIGFPLIGDPNCEALLRDYVLRVKDAWAAR